MTHRDDPHADNTVERSPACRPPAILRASRRARVRSQPRGSRPALSRSRTIAAVRQSIRRMPGCGARARQGVASAQREAAVPHAATHERSRPRNEHTHHPEGVCVCLRLRRSSAPPIAHPPRGPTSPSEEPGEAVPQRVGRLDDGRRGLRDRDVDDRAEVVGRRHGLQPHARRDKRPHHPDLLDGRHRERQDVGALAYARPDRAEIVLGVDAREQAQLVDVRLEIGYHQPDALRASPEQPVCQRVFERARGDGDVLDEVVLAQRLERRHLELVGPVDEGDVLRLVRE
mmetsp:Transcript_22848/g.67262  ORF Transcript_22848/g.67262 Transcript_22848/m.67262 type:complete len:287 (-) Transcript_22848:68-928(-)